jgi:hypothetical protein
MIVKNKLTPVDRAFWAHVEAVAKEVDLWPKWMRGGSEVETGLCQYNQTGHIGLHVRTLYCEEWVGGDSVSAVRR